MNVRAGGAIDLHQVSESEPLPNPVTLRGHDGDVTAATFLGRQDGRFATVGNDGLVPMWDFRFDNAFPFPTRSAESSGPWLSSTGEWRAVVQPADKGSWKLLLQRVSTEKTTGPLVLDPGSTTVDTNTPDQSEKMPSGGPSSVPRSGRESPVETHLEFVTNREGVLCFVAASDARGVYVWPIGDGPSVGRVSVSCSLQGVGSQPCHEETMM